MAKKKRDSSVPPPTVYPAGVACPVPYCKAEPHFKCCDRLGFYLRQYHTQRVGKARQAVKEQLRLRHLKRR